jgi:hypothetical protein
MIRIVVRRDNIIYKDGEHAGCIYQENGGWTVFVHCDGVEETLRAHTFTEAVKMANNFFDKVEETA